MRSRRSGVLRNVFTRLQAIAMIVWAESRHAVERQLIRVPGEWFRLRLERRILALESGSVRPVLHRDRLTRAYELMATLHESRGEYAVAKYITKMHAEHPMLPAEDREDIYVWAGLRALRQKRYDDAREFLELAKANHSGERKPPFFGVLENALNS